MWKIAGVFGLGGMLMLLVPVRADEDANVRELIARAIKAQGGSENLTKLKANTSKQKGKVHVLGQALDFTGDTWVQLPDRLRSEVRSKFADQEINFLQIIAGGKGWIKVANMTQEMDKGMLEEAKEQMNAANITHLVCLSDKEYQLSPLGEVKVGDRPAVGVRVQRKGYRDVNLFFDKDKHLLLKMETRGKDPMQGGQEYTSTTRYEDYKKVEGMMVAHKVVIERDGKPYVEAEISDVKLSEKLDDNLFDKP